MNNFGLSRSRRCDIKHNLALAPCIEEVKDEFPVVIDGAELLDQVCPVSSLTGNRMSIYEAMQMVGSEKYSRALNALLPEVPSIMSDTRLSDDDRVALLASRLDTGSSSENQRLTDSIAKIVSDFADKSKVVAQNVSTDTIKFDASETPNVEGNE